METITEKIENFVQTVRPYLKRDGGDFEFVKFEDGIVYIRMLGACAGCGSSMVTVSSIEEMMVEEIPGIIAVKSI